VDFGVLLPLISEENPFMGPFAQDYFNDLGVSTDFNRPLTRDFFYSASDALLGK
jgi:hypothetical protein